MNRHTPSDLDAPSDEEQDALAPNTVSIEQLQHLVQLLDSSDVSEIEVKHVEDGTRLVLRKAKLSTQQDVQLLPSTPGELEEKAIETRHTITAPLVGFFHTWTRPGGKPQVAVGDMVKVGQLVGSVQSLNVINEIETPFAGRIVEIQVQDGHSVEYGQPLMIVESAEER